MPLVDMVRALVKNFQEQYGVTAEMLEAYIGCKKEAFSQQSVIRLKNVYNAIRDGSASVEQYFDMSIASSVKPEKSGSESNADSATGDGGNEQVNLDDL